MKILDGVEKSDVTVKELKELFPIKSVKNISNILPDSDKFDRRKLLLSLEELYHFSFPLDVPGCLGHNDPSFKFTSDSYSEVSLWYIYHFEAAVECTLALLK